MRWFPFLGFVSSRDEPDLAAFLELKPQYVWSILVFKWFDYTFAFYAYSSGD